MPELKPVPSLSHLCGVAACHWVKRTVLACVPPPLPDDGDGEEEDEDDDDRAGDPGDGRFDRACDAVVAYLSSVPRSLVTDMAVEYMALVSGTVDEHLLLASVLGRCGLRAVSFERFPFWPEYFDASGSSLLSRAGVRFGRALTQPGALAHVQRLNLSRMDSLNFAGHDELLRAVAVEARGLKYLDLANRGSAVTDRSVRYFCPSADEPDQVPCPELEYFSVYDCDVGAGALADLALCHPKLSFLGFKRMGLVLKLLADECDDPDRGRPSNWRTELTHVSNVGTKRDVTSMGSSFELGVNHALVHLIDRLCPKLLNLKVRVSDGSVSHLQRLMDRVKFLELCYCVGTPTNVGRNSLRFLFKFGSNLTSLAILCNRVKYSQLLAIGEACPNLSQLWLKLNCLSNDLDFRLDRGADGEEEEVVQVQAGADLDLDFEVEAAVLLQLGVVEAPSNNVFGWSSNSRKRIDSSRAGHFKNLKIMHLQVGSHWAEEARLQQDVLVYLLQDKPLLETCNVLATRGSCLDDLFVMRLVLSNWTPELRTVNFSIPGWTQKPRVLPLTESSIKWLATMPRIREISNVMSWSVDQAWVLGFRRHLKTGNVDLKLVSR